MRDYGGFGEESFYDYDGNGDLDIWEQACMHTEQDFEMKEMFNDRSASSGYNSTQNKQQTAKTGCGTKVGLLLIGGLFMWLGDQTGVGFFYLLALADVILLAIC